MAEHPDVLGDRGKALEDEFFRREDQRLINGIAAGTTKYELLESWLDRKPAPNLIAAWGELIQGMREHMPPQEFESLRKEFIARAHAVARASGGVLGIGATSGAEQDAIARLEAAFRPR